jgi:acetyl-CoA carboxylase biotin carboxylase subunit
MSLKVLIANRGEIALRVIRACKELGIPTVAVYSTVDEDSLHVKFADEAICIGEADSSKSYLNYNQVLSAAISTGCNAIHPGYGFLAENPLFVEMVEASGITFIGPSADVISKMGDKAEARKLAIKSNIPVVMGSDGTVDDDNQGLKIAKKIGYPVMIKATSGGGGRGIGIAKNDEEFRQVFKKTSLEAKVSFGNPSLYIEKFIESPRHIEIQILCDAFGNCVHLFERDCSLQRRNQKLLEEAPAFSLSENLRTKMGEASVKLAKEVGYINAGTIEFIVDAQENFYFIEMNTRIQVEHPITEMITGIDLIKEQIKVAQKKKLSFTQKDIKINGHAIECRINAEDPYHNFMPRPGTIKNAVFPGGLGVRLDTHIYPGYKISPYYDSMLAKIIVHAPTRTEAIRKMRIALEQFVIEGVTTNIEYQYLLVHHTDFIKGHYDTGFIARFQNLVEDAIK